MLVKGTSDQHNFPKFITVKASACELADSLMNCRVSLHYPLFFHRLLRHVDNAVDLEGNSLCPGGKCKLDFVRSLNGTEPDQIDARYNIITVVVML